MRRGATARLPGFCARQKRNEAAPGPPRGAGAPDSRARRRNLWAPGLPSRVEGDFAASPYQHYSRLQPALQSELLMRMPDDQDRDRRAGCGRADGVGAARRTAEQDRRAPQMRSSATASAGAINSGTAAPRSSAAQTGSVRLTVKARSTATMKIKAFMG